MKYLVFDLNDDESIRTVYTSTGLPQFDSSTLRYNDLNWQFPPQYFGGKVLPVKGLCDGYKEKLIMLFYRIPGTMTTGDRWSATEYLRS